ncbi:MAG TPA: ABC transporter permease [Thermomicrobiales bacterium]|nr:ABC transporter permease [Thermomicrobiales bacterium]
MSVELSSAGRLAFAREVRQRHWSHRVVRNRNLIIGAAMVGTIALVALFAPILSAHDPIAHDYTRTLQSPSLSHPFGTDNFGRDVFTRVIYGGRIDLRVGIISVIPPFVIGIVLGSLAGYYGGRIDSLIMRGVDLVQAFPFIVLIIAIVAVLGPGLNNMYIAVAIVAWVVYARLIRGQILVEKQKEYVQAARAIGSSDIRILGRHLLPNCIIASIVFSMADIALYIGLAASLSYLGLGAKPPSPEWGAMITDGQNFMVTAWWMSAIPGLAIVVTGIAFSLIGDGLSDVLRPESR